MLVDGLPVTGPARTAFDIALSRPFEDAVVVADGMLRLYPDAAEEFAGLVESYGTRRGHRRVRAVCDFADGASGSAGESMSRVGMLQLGFAKPVLQVRVTTEIGDEFADFGWPRSRTLGEFDGETRYREERYRKGGTVDDVVTREKDVRTACGDSGPAWPGGTPTTSGRTVSKRSCCGPGVPKRIR